MQRKQSRVIDTERQRALTMNDMYGRLTISEAEVPAPRYQHQDHLPVVLSRDEVLILQKLLKGFVVGPSGRAVLDKLNAVKG
jgi:hypothetical protein